MKILGIIPARYASTRFPAKPLADIGGKTMIRRVYEQVKKCALIDTVVVATDHPEIFNHVSSFGGGVCMTSENHPSGTDRCYEALTLQKEQFDYVINVQGDEPFIQPVQIELLATLLDGETELATLVKKIDQSADVFNPNIVKAVTGGGRALYFSRSAVPHVRGVPENEWVTRQTFYKHIGMYAYRSDVLERITRLPQGTLEKAESLEQLRWLESGFRIHVAETNTESIGIDTPEDLRRATLHLQSSGV